MARYSVIHPINRTAALLAITLSMELNTEIELKDVKKPIRLREALYMDEPIWAVSIDQKTYLLRRIEHGWQQDPINAFDREDLRSITDLIETIEKHGYSSIDAGKLLS